MTDNVYRFPDRSEVRIEASQWLAKLDREEVPGQEDLEELAEWLGRSPLHSQELADLNAFWGNNSLTALMVPIGRCDNKYDDLSATNERPKAFAIKLGLPLVACLLVVAMFVLNPLIENDPFAGINHHYQTVVGQQELISLPDGSTVHLNTNSEVDVSYSEQRRVVRLLRGEAYFEVARMLDRPFHVYANGGLVQAVGTAFSVRLLNGSLVDVLVTEGSVAIAPFDHERPDSGGSARSMESDNRSKIQGKASSEVYKPVEILKAGQAIIIDTKLYPQLGETDSGKNETAAIKTVSSEDLLRRQAWREGVLKFSGDPLGQVVAEISRYTSVKIEIIDPSLMSLEIGGRMVIGDVSVLLEILEMNFGIRVTRVDDTYIQLSAAAD